MSKDLNEVLNYMKQYVEDKYKHDSEPMLNYKDLQLVLEEIERLKDDNKYLNKVNIELSSEKNRLKSIIKEVRGKLYDLNYKIKEIHNVPFNISEIFEIIDLLDKENNNV